MNAKLEGWTREYAHEFGWITREGEDETEDICLECIEKEEYVRSDDF